MTRWRKRAAALLAALVMIFSLLQRDGAAVLEGVYFTAVNDRLMSLSSETMPFWANNKMYICHTAFDGTDLGVHYVRNYGKGLAVLYTSKTNLQFNLEKQTVCDKNGVAYSGNAIERNGYVFFPVDLVCQYFGLRWSLSGTATIPLVRIKSDGVVLDDRSFIDAASSMMASRYAEYEKLMNSVQQEDNNQTGDEVKEPEKEPDTELPPVHAVDGQKVYLILAARSEESVREMMKILGDTPATFLLTVQQMENGDLLRALLGSGHAVALMMRSEAEDEIRAELLRARELVWMASCSLLQLVWYGGDADMAALYEEQGCVSVSADIDRSGIALRSESSVDATMRLVGRYREDVSLYLGYDDRCTEGMDDLLDALIEAQYRLCAWRLTA